jgi:hypothetical protein
MRNRQLHDALRAFALEAAALLRDDQNAGAEVEFDLDSGDPRRRGPSLYHYKPLTGKFIADRWHRLRSLPSRPDAAAALGAGAAAYLRANGLRGAEADPALQSMLERIYEEATDLTFPEERFERVYAEVERTLYNSSRPATVLVPVHGLSLWPEQVDLGDGVEIVRGDRSDAPDEAVWADPVNPSADGERRDPNALLTLTREIDPDDPLPLEEARLRFRETLTGLRLWKPGGVALGAVAWRRSGDGAWQPFELESTGVARSEPWVLAEGETEELREFFAAIATARVSGSVAWALSRFEMGCGRRLEGEALSDYLLALRALLDTTADSSRSSLALRVAVLCAEEGERKQVQRRVELAQALERFVMGDGVEEDYLDTVGSESSRTLVEEVERHLRALLRDILCGYLDSDLRAVSDDFLLEPPRASAPEPASTPVTAVAASRREEWSSKPQPELDFDDADEEGVTTEIEAIEASGEEFGVTAVEGDREVEYDWDDPASYSAPV